MRSAAVAVPYFTLFNLFWLGPFSLSFFEAWRSSEEEIVAVERDFRVVLPGVYKRFMATIGGGLFGFLDIYPLDPRSNSNSSFRSINSSRSWDADLIAVAPMGTGDLWGFLVADGACSDEVYLLDHETDEVRRKYPGPRTAIWPEFGRIVDPDKWKREE